MRSKSGAGYDSNAEKQRDYRNVVFTQAVLVAIALLLEDFIDLFGGNSQRQFFYSAFLVLATIYYYLIWDLVRNFVKNRVMVYGLLVLMVVDFGTLFIAEFPFGKIISDPSPYLIMVHSILFLTEMYVMYHVFTDIFGKNEVSFSKLWGSVGLFIMMAIAFASIYEVINMVVPGSFGVPLEVGFPTFSESLYFSLVTISGGAPLLPDISHLVRDVAAIEGVLGTLYLVILIGRIIGRV